MIFIKNIFFYKKQKIFWNLFVKYGNLKIKVITMLFIYRKR